MNARPIPLVFRCLALLAVLVLAAGGARASIRAAPAEQTVSFTGSELLGRPTDTSITINIVPAATIEYCYEYGTTEGGPYPDETSRMTATGGELHEVVITDLSPDTRYYYRMIYDGDGDVDDGSYEVRDEHTFHTQRAEGEAFVFTVASDSHATLNAEHRQAMQNVLADQPDFHLDLGDTFALDDATSQDAVDAKYLAYRSAEYIGAIGPSVPIFLTAGEHENEEGWNLDDTPFSIALASIQARKAYYPTPIEDGFYTGNVDPLEEIDEGAYGDDYREDYYAWEWGDALFVVLDEYQYTMDLPYSPTGGEGSDDPVTGDQWSWTLGEQQFNWFRQTIQESDARYRFVFSHQVTGGIPEGGGFSGGGYARGGAGAAPYFEWGGQNADGTWGFDDERAGWGGVPIHQLMVESGVSAYFHGHDHQFAHEELDGVVYQEVPSPSVGGSGYSGVYDDADPYTIEILPNSGHLRVTVSPTEATVEYVRSNETGVSYAYTIAPNEIPDPEYVITATAGVNGSISPSGAVTVTQGGDQAFVISPDAGDQVADVLVDESSVGAVSSYTFTNVHDDHTIEASFEALPTTYDLTVAIDPPDGGTTDPPVGTHGCGEGDIVEIAATPALGYAFVHWVGDVADADALTTTVTMDADKVLTATFTPVTHALTIMVEPIGGGTTTPAPGTHTYTEGAEVTITPAPATGYAFDHWGGDCSGSGICQVTMDAGKVVTATFADVTPPETMITAHPADPCYATDASFNFASTEIGSTFECQLDGGGFGPCTPPHACTGLDYGGHTFEVRAIDGAGNPDPTPARYSWTINRALFLPLIRR